MSILLGHILRKCRLHPVTLELIWEEFPHPTYDDWTDRFLIHIREDDYEANEDTNEANVDEKMKILEEVFPTLEWDTIIYPNIRSATFRKRSSYLHDDQRLGGIAPNIPENEWSWSIETPTGLTIRNITEGVFRMKQSKNNFWNELFLNIKTTVTETHMEIESDFSFGS